MEQKSPKQIAAEIFDLNRGRLGAEFGLLTALVLVYAFSKDRHVQEVLVTNPDRIRLAMKNTEDYLLADSLPAIDGELVVLPDSNLARVGELVISQSPVNQTEIFEELLRLHESNAGRAAGEYRTMGWVAQLVSEIVSLDPGQTAIDPACGFGDMMIELAKVDVEPYGADISPEARNVSRLRLAIHGVGEHVENADFLKSWQQVRGEHHSIVMSPPWGVRPSKSDEIELPSWVTTKSPLDLAWLAMGTEALPANGQLVAHLPAGVVERSRDVDAVLQLVTQGRLEAVINLGSGSSPATAINSVIVVVRPVGTSDTVLMVDASALGTRGKKGSTSLDHSEIREITNCLRDFRESDSVVKSDFHRPGFARGVSLQQILGSTPLSLSPSRFVDVSEKGHEIPEPSQTLLTELRLEGFKPFRKPTSVRLAPITVLFGQNSAGKSSLVQALMMLKQSVKANHFVADGEVVQLGSFGTLVNGHDLDRPVRLGVSFGVPVDWHTPGLVLNPGWLRSIDFEFRGSVGSEVRLERVIVDLGEGHVASFDFDPRADGLAMTAEDAVNLVRHVAEGESRWRIAAPTAKRTETGPASFRKQRVSEVKRVLSRIGDYLPVKVEGLVPASADLAISNYGKGKAANDGELASSSIDGSLALPAKTGEELGRLLSEMKYLGPLRSAPERVYPRRTGDGGIGNSGENLAIYLFEHRSELDEINRWLDRLEMPYRLDVVSLDAGVKGLPVGDLVALILTDHRSGAVVSPADVGFGISQVLPIVTQLLANRQTVIAVEQPEIHLHPGLQARFAELLIDATRPESASNQVIVETHSEHLMLRLQRRVREGELSPDEVSVLYVDWNEEEACAEVIHIPLDEDGSFTRAWPNGFFAERFDEIFSGGLDLPELPDETAL
ncbi:MAG: AAA family ATPase [Solirubrobacterales bacterium]|nr:AAA family ATPase [Solirubrobacterales bacterium]